VIYDYAYEKEKKQGVKASQVFMNQEKLEETIQFLVENQSKLQSDIQQLAEIVLGIAVNQKRTDEQIQALTGNIESMRLETGEVFKNLTIANEITRELTVQIGSLAVQVTQRVNNLEGKNRP
jgi:predicted  nucleic acid-binding Zn-ribbon protein